MRTFLSPYAIGCLTVIAGGLVLSLGVFCIRSAPDADPFQYVLWRAVGFVSALTIVASLRGSSNAFAQLRSLGPLDWVGAASMAGSATTFIMALKVSTFAEVFFICSLAPLITAALAFVVLRERLAWSTLVAIVVALAGVYIMVEGDFAGGNWVGRALGLAAGVFFASYTLATRAAKSTQLDAMLIGFGLISIVVAVGALTLQGKPYLPSTGSAALAVFHGFMVLSLGLWLYGQGSRSVSAVTLSMLAQTEAVASPVFAAIAFRETVGAAVIAGGGLIFGAVVGQAIAASRQVVMPER